MRSLFQQYWRTLLPAFVSAALLIYLFGWATDWDSLMRAIRGANAPLFLAATAIDRLAFFVVWTSLQAAAIRRFVASVPVRSVFAIRGGSEILRAVSHGLSDGAFFLGLTQLVRKEMEVVVAAALIPAVCHMLVMLVQVSIALLLLEGGIAENRDVATAAGILWAIVIGVALAVRLSATRDVPIGRTVRGWLDRFPIRTILPFFGWFLGVAMFDVFIQGVATRAFGVPIDWAALMGRIPLLYLAMVVPSLGNFGPRELAWAALFEGYGERDALIAFAFATNTIHMLLNVMLGVIFLPRAVNLIAELRRARRKGEAVPAPLIRDPTET